ncbi:MAG: restriction endonuclease [Candidatus Roizmanbacteria bacterium]
MAIPKFHQTFLAILKALEHGNEQKTSDLPDQILKYGHIKLTPEEVSERLDSGELRYHNRVFWAVSYLYQGKFVERPSRGLVKITKKGIDFLHNKPSEFTLKMIEDDSDFQSYVPTRSKKDELTTDVDTNDMTPVDLIEQGFGEVTKSLKKDLLDKLHQSNPYYFEKIVLRLFKKMGYGDFEETAKSRDGGIDGIINQDQLGIEKIYIQAKRYADGNRVREPEIRNFIGAMSGDVSKGIFVTTSLFDDSAKQKAKNARNHKIILIDGDQLVSLMIKYNIGVQVKNTYEVKEVDEDFFELS